MIQLTRLLLTGYGLAAILGAASAYSGGSAVSGLLLFWLGGAVATLAIAATPGLGRLFRAKVPVEAETERQADKSLRCWEEDRAADTTAATAATRSTG